MILVANNDSTKKLTSTDIRMLAECDDARTYTECGWFCILGYKGNRRVVHAHANNEAEFLGLAAGMGYRWAGGAMAEMTPKERSERNRAFKYR